MLDNVARPVSTRLVRRDGSVAFIALPPDGSSLMPLFRGHTGAQVDGPTLEDICLRISCGVATGADELFVMKASGLRPSLRRFAHPTISGRQLAPGTDEPRSPDAMLIPYDDGGALLPLEQLGALRDYLTSKTVRALLEARTCARRKPWYAFHDSVPFAEMLRPKILCKDIGAAPRFWIDRDGSFVPRHSVYYIVPKDASRLDELAAFLNGPDARAWLVAHCQRAANDFLQLQSAVLERLPVPAGLVPTGSAGLAHHFDTDGGTSGEGPLTSSVPALTRSEAEGRDRSRRQSPTARIVSRRAVGGSRSNDLAET